MIEFKVYKNGNKTKSQFVKGPDGYYACTNREFFEIIRQYNKTAFWFNDCNNGLDITYEKLMLIIKSQEHESTKESDTNLMNRIIINGGFFNYIKKLESNNASNR